MEYRKLTAEDAVEYVKSVPGLFSKQATLSGSEISDGNMNFVFRVAERENEEKSVILKQALPYMRAVGPSWPLTPDRIRVEYETLTIQNEICPELVPNIYHYDEKLKLMVMEDLVSHHILRDGLIAEKHYPSLAKQIGTFLARMLFSTSVFTLTDEGSQKFKLKFENRTMCKISQDFIFTYPFQNHPMNRYNPLIQKEVSDIWGNHKLKVEIENIKHQFMTNKQALLHGDLHTGSIMVTDNDTKVIDAEFAFYGPMGFDIGLFFANVLMDYASHRKEEHADDQDDLLNLIRMSWDELERQFRKLSKQHRNYASFPDMDEFLSSLFHDSLGFAGCEMMRRVMGTSHVEDIERIVEDEARANAETFVLCMGQKLIMERNYIQNPRELFLAIKQLEEQRDQSL
ncbi:5'-methylthioribose kinase [Scopulibacillus darangshiensis]|uniref:S-methyl-5-thioribose kinase n=1 Tax=Scopulibacillus darangshiensis TaxID=442528 RepID=A0A4R2P5H3_9BACL|nr:S-methyl-5-thioribose kinase [Scopulibacillus darangshiensis]TCP29937.1 5'-methylthioribose kinase [Scopulibacillus darangshiensis]